MSNEAALRDRVDYLEAENAELRRLLRADPEQDFIDRIRVMLGGRRTSAKVLWALWDCNERSREALFHVVWGDRLDPPDIKNLDAQVCMLRRLVRPLGADIVTLWGRGYQLLPADRTKIAAHIGMTLQGEVAA